MWIGGDECSDLVDEVGAGDGALAEVAAPAWSVLAKPASTVRTSSGSRVSRTTARVAIPSVPSDPTKAPTRS